MTEWFLRQINATENLNGSLEHVTVQFHQPWFLLGLLLLLPLGVLIYLRQAWNLASVPAWVRLVLTACRVVILALLVIILAGPFLKLDRSEEKKPVVAFLFDHSDSMQLAAGPFESDSELGPIARAAGYRTSIGAIDSETRKALNRISRAKLAQSVVQAQAEPLLAPLAKKYDLAFYSFSRDVTQMGVNAIKPEFPEPANPGGPATHLGDAVGKLLEEGDTRQVAGIVVFTDGQNTGGRSPLDAARLAKAGGTPLVTVPVGTMTRLRDVAIADLFTTGLVSVGDTARVSVTIESQGFDKRNTKVLLKDGDKVLDSKDLILNSAEQQQIDLTFKTTRAGPHYLKVEVPPQPEEAEDLRRNNTDTAFLQVSEEKLKVLYIEGLPRWDFRFLKNAMRRDNGLGGVLGKDVDVRLEAEWRRLPPAQQKQALPRTLEQMSQYHTVILGDVSPQMLDNAFLEVLDKAVRDKGVGLIVEAGVLAMPHRYGDVLQSLLPVRLRPQLPGQLPQGVASFRLELAPEGVIHEATRFYDDPGRNQNAWAQMPRYYWSAASEKPAPGATVLVWNPLPSPRAKIPLIAHHYAGKGRVMFVGTDSTWLWRQNVGDRFFYKFWGQSLRYVARRDDSAGKKSRLEVRPVRSQPGEPAEIELRAVTADGSPLTAPTAPVLVTGGGESLAVDLTADPAVKGRYVGRFVPTKPETYYVKYNSPGTTDPVEAQLHATVAPEERRQPNINRPLLQLMADSSGGQMLELGSLDEMQDYLKGESRFSEVHREADLWDNWMTLTVLIVLYSMDVGLRRLLGLS